MLQILVDLVKIGAIGAGLAFLLLSYQLLKAETKLKDATGNPIRPRVSILLSIGMFAVFSLVFLILGVLSEIVLANQTALLSTLSQRLLQNDLVRVRLNTWEFHPEISQIAFSFEENRINTKLYMLPAMKDDYDVFVGVRKQDAIPYDTGQYPLMFGPFHVSTLSRVQKSLSSQELQLLGSGCVEFTAFAVKRDGANTQVTTPFTPGRPPQTVVFNTASACMPK